VGGASGLEIGLGTTTNQSAYLDLVGDATYTDYGLRIIRDSTGVNADSSIKHKGTGVLALVTEEAAPILLVTSNTERLRITSAGNVGIGTTSPGVLLDCQGTGSQFIRVRTNDTSGIAVGGLRAEYLGGSGGINTNVELRAGDSYSLLANTTNHPLLFGTNALERARIDSSGRLLVGTSTSLGVAAPQGGQLQVADTTVGIGSITTFANNTNGGFLMFGKSRGATVGSYTVVQNNDQLGTIRFGGSDGTDLESYGASIEAYVNGTPGANDMPGRLVFSTTADGAASPTERLSITSAGVLLLADAGDITVGTTTGTKIGTATTQKLGFYNATPVVQPTAVADATDAATVITQLNDLLAKLRTLGIIAA
jgi:predicted aconitase with swiveling domain